jgi:hypothetical protein
MQTPEILNEKIQRLETYYAELLGDNADFDALNKIWSEIKMLKRQLLLIQLAQSDTNSFISANI